MKNKKYLLLVLPLVTLVLEILPYGAVLNFSNPEGESWRQTYPYFSLTPFGYANFSPFVTAVLTCFTLLLLVIYCIKSQLRVAVVSRTLLVIATLCSLCPMLYGFECFSLTGAFISLLLLAETVCVSIMVKKQK